MQQTSKRGNNRWTTEEHRILEEVLAGLGLIDSSGIKWADIVKLLPFQRTAKQCRQHWTSCNTYSKKGSWTTEEEQHLALLHVCYGNKWAKIAQSMPGRCETAVKNHFNAFWKSNKLSAKHDRVLANYIALVRDHGAASNVATYASAVKQTQQYLAALPLQPTKHDACLLLPPLSTSQNQQPPPHAVPHHNTDLHCQLPAAKSVQTMQLTSTHDFQHDCSGTLGSTSLTEAVEDTTCWFHNPMDTVPPVAAFQQHQNTWKKLGPQEVRMLLRQDSGSLTFDNQCSNNLLAQATTDRPASGGSHNHGVPYIGDADLGFLHRRDDLHTSVVGNTTTFPMAAISTTPLGTALAQPTWRDDVSLQTGRKQMMLSDDSGVHKAGRQIERSATATPLVYGERAICEWSRIPVTSHDVCQHAKHDHDNEDDRDFEMLWAVLNKDDHNEDDSALPSEVLENPVPTHAVHHADIMHHARIQAEQSNLSQHHTGPPVATQCSPELVQSAHTVAECTFSLSEGADLRSHSNTRCAQPERDSLALWHQGLPMVSSNQYNMQHPGNASKALTFKSAKTNLEKGSRRVSLSALKASKSSSTTCGGAPTAFRLIDHVKSHGSIRDVAEHWDAQATPPPKYLTQQQQQQSCYKREMYTHGHGMVSQPPKLHHNVKGYRSGATINQRPPRIPTDLNGFQRANACDTKMQTWSQSKSTCTSLDSTSLFLDGCPLGNGMLPCNDGETAVLSNDYVPNALPGVTQFQPTGQDADLSLLVDTLDMELACWKVDSCSDPDVGDLEDYLPRKRIRTMSIRDQTAQQK